MPKAARKTFRKRGKKPYPNTKSVQVIKKVVKTALTKQIETKFFKHLVDGEGIKNVTPTTWNIFYHGVTRGTNENQLIGDKLNWQGISFKYTFFNAYWDGGYVFQNWPHELHVAPIETDSYVALSSLTYSQIWQNTTGNPNSDFLVTGVRIVAHNKHVMKPDVASATVPRVQLNGVLKFFPKGGRKLQFKDTSLSSHELVNKNYYLCIYTVGNLAGTGGFVDTLTGTWRNYFKDA